MAQLSGVMTADFSDFFFEVDKAVVKTRELENAGKSMGGGLSQLSDGLGTVDKTLGAFGVHIGPQIQALRELGNTAGLTWEKMGTIGGLGLAGTVGVLSFQITRLGLEFLGLDKVVDDFFTNLGTHGAMSAERTGAKMDVLARATNLAGREITDFDVALQIIKKSNDDMSGALNNGAERFRQWSKVISDLRKSGDLETINKDLRDGTSTVKELAAEHKVSAEALQYHATRLKENDAILKQWHEAEDERLKKTKLAQDELSLSGEGWRKNLIGIPAATAASATAYIALGQSLTTIATALNLTKVQVEALDKAYQQQTLSIAMLEPKVSSLDTWMITAAKQFKVAADDGYQFKTMLELTGGSVDTLVPKIEKLDTVFRSVTEAAAVSPVGGGMTQKSPGNAAVGINTGDITYGTLGSFEATFAEYMRRNPSGGALGGAIGGGPPKDFLTWALSMGLAQRGPTITNTFNIVDTQDGIARKVGDTITTQVQRGSLVN